MRTLSASIRKIAYASGLEHWANDIQRNYGLKYFVDGDVVNGAQITKEVLGLLKRIPDSLIKDSGFTLLGIKYLGPNAEFFPNHGYFSCNDGSIVLNSDIFNHPDFPDDFRDSKGKTISRAMQTFAHEIGHAYDFSNNYISLKAPWLGLSDWNQGYKPGLKRLRIKKPGVEDVVGDWYYNPKAGFCRFYGKKEPEDDFADCFGYYVGGLKSKVPPNKIGYMDKLLGKYYT